MPSLKEIKNRITSVQSTRKITSAMKMVASSKLHHAQMMIENMLPYENLLESMLKTYLEAEVDARTVLTLPREVKKAALIVFASNSSLCGGFKKINRKVYPLNITVFGFKVTRISRTAAKNHRIICF